MDSRIRSLVVSHGGYTYEIAGCVVAFFSDPRQSRAFGALLAHLTQVAVDCCGSQLTFPVSARLGNNPAPKATAKALPEPYRRAADFGPRPLAVRTPAPLRSTAPESAADLPERGTWNRMTAPGVAGMRPLRLPTHHP